MEVEDDLLLVVGAGEEPFNEDDGTSVSCGMRPKELKFDSGVAEADEGVEAV